MRWILSEIKHLMATDGTGKDIIKLGVIPAGSFHFFCYLDHLYLSLSGNPALEPLWNRCASAVITERDGKHLKREIEGGNGGGQQTEGFDTHCLGGKKENRQCSPGQEGAELSLVPEMFVSSCLPDNQKKPLRNYWCSAVRSFRCGLNVDLNHVEC